MIQESLTHRLLALHDTAQLMYSLKLTVTSRLVKLASWAERCASHKSLLVTYGWLYVFRPFKFVQGHRLLHKLKAHIHFLLVINCDISIIWPRFWDITTLPFKITQNYRLFFQLKSTKWSTISDQLWHRLYNLAPFPTSPRKKLKTTPSWF